MIKLVVMIFALTSMAISMPAKEKLDQATINDVSLNDVSGEKKNADTAIQVVVEASTVPNVPPSLRPQHGGSAFARIIDDIFQIPITVLQSVSRLLTNPFLGGHKTPENASGY